ncbi:MAG TPA: ATP-binding protein [Acidimicrobiales bacterium]|nr:ATP-binding protein [Acidimicrobiales bacterium]
MVRRLLATYLTITAFVLAVVVVPLGLVFADREHDRLVFDIERDAQAVASLVEDDLEAGGTPSIDSVSADYADTGGRIVVVDTDGVSVVDSDRPAGDRRDFSTRPEIAAALDGRRTSGTRDSETAGTGLLYVAVPVASGGVVHGAVRVTYPTSAVDARVSSMWLRLGALSAVVLLTVALVGMVLARSVTRPVRRLEGAAQRLAAGDLAARVEAGDGAPELRALAATFNLMADRLAHLVASHRRFVADASHQLRTPLTALRLRLETLEPDVPTACRPKLAAAVAETERLARLVDSLLVLARSDAATDEIAVVDLHAIATGRAASWRPVARERGAEVTVEDPGTTLVRAPLGALEQILDNLLSNALGVAPPGTAVTVRIVEAAPWIELHVTDQGPGMSPEVRDHAFERFWRPPGATGKGFGLGLAIVDQLARACGGDTRLDAGPDGQGLDAVVRLRGGTARRDGTGARRAGKPNPALTSG